MPSVLFVCTANLFRSPLAEGIFRLLLEVNDLSGWRVSSAGTWAVPGLPAMDDAQKIAGSFGVDISMHRSNPISVSLFQEFNLIMVMESGHKEAITIEFPSFEDQVYLLSEAAGNQPFDIPDPSSNDESPQSIGNEIQSIIVNGFQNIIALAQKIEKDLQVK